MAVISCNNRKLKSHTIMNFSLFPSSLLALLYPFSFLAAYALHFMPYFVHISYIHLSHPANFLFCNVIAMEALSAVFTFFISRNHVY